jgi:hypothetical protein
MRLLIHGSDIEKSREYYFQEKNKLQNPISLEGEGLTFDAFFQAAENKSLFEEQIIILIENLFSKNKSTSTEIKRIIQFINNSKNLSVILWEQTEITKTSQGQLKNFDIKPFIIPQKLFQFLDNLRPNNSNNLIKLFHELIETQEPELIFFMLVRQFRLFLQAAGNYPDQIDEVKRMAPWQLSKLTVQTRNFSKNQLIKLYNQLFEIETNQKTGKTSYPITTSIDFFLSDL